MKIELSDLIVDDPDLKIITNGEAAILAKLDRLDGLEEKLDEVIEKLSNLSLEGDGLHIERDIF